MKISCQHNKDFLLSKISSQINILCLSQPTCDIKQFIQWFSPERCLQNQIQKIYLRKEDHRVTFLHQWIYKKQLYIFQQFDGIIFCVDLINHLNNTTQTILRILEILSKTTGINIFKIPILLLVLHDKSINNYNQQVLYLQQSTFRILNRSQIVYFQRNRNSFGDSNIKNSNLCKQNSNLIDKQNSKQKQTQKQKKLVQPIKIQKLQHFINNIFDGEVIGIKQSLYMLYMVYGIQQLFAPNFMEIHIVINGWVQKYKALFHRTKNDVMLKSQKWNLPYFRNTLN